MIYLKTTPLLLSTLTCMHAYQEFMHHFACRLIESWVIIQNIYLSIAVWFCFKLSLNAFNRMRLNWCLCESNGKAEQHQLMLHIKSTVCGRESIDSAFAQACKRRSINWWWHQLLRTIGWGSIDAFVKKFYFRFKIWDFEAELNKIFILKWNSRFQINFSQNLNTWNFYVDWISSYFGNFLNTKISSEISPRTGF